MWLYENKEFTSDMIGDNVGFVYEITDTHNGMKYIGKKWFRNTKKLPPLKGKSRKRTVVKESDWMDYYGSNNIIKSLVEEFGTDRFKREILKLCRTKGECTYYESKYQFERDVLLRDDYYNDFIMCRIQGSHVKHLKDD